MSEPTDEQIDGLVTANRLVTSPLVNADAFVESVVDEFVRLGGSGAMKDIDVTPKT